MKLQEYQCDRCPALFDEEGRGTCWKLEGLGKLCGDDHEWYLCEACDDEAREAFDMFLSVRRELSGR